MPEFQESWIIDYINEIQRASSPIYWKTHKYCSEGLIRSPHFPKKIYRYREISERECHTLCEYLIWLSSFETFKDDDCLVSLNSKKLKLWNKIRILRNYCLNKVGFERINTPYEDCFVGNNPNIWLKNVISLFYTISVEIGETDPNGQYMELMKTVEDEDYLSYFRKNVFDGVGICCFSQSYTSSCLWKKYSNKAINNIDENGMCIEYNLDRLTTEDIQKKLIYPVYYSDTIPDISPIIFHNVTAHNGAYNFSLLNIILTKRTEFIYENEWRIVIPNIISEGEKGTSFPMIKPSAIYLGTDVTDEKREMVCKIAEKCEISLIQLRKISENNYDEIDIIRF